MRSVLIFLFVAFLLSVWFGSCQKSKADRLANELAVSGQNQAALSDSLRIEQNERGEWESARTILIGSLNDLEQINRNLTRRINRLDGRLEVALAATATVEATDTLAAVVESLVVDTSHTRAAWVYDPPLPPGNRLLVEGLTTYAADSITVDVTRHLVAVDLVMGIRVREDGLREAVATSTWPGLVVDVEGAILEPELVIRQKRRGWLLPAGIGFVVGVVAWEIAR